MLRLVLCFTDNVAIILAGLWLQPISLSLLLSPATPTLNYYPHPSTPPPLSSLPFLSASLERICLKRERERDRVGRRGNPSVEWICAPSPPPVYVFCSSSLSSVTRALQARWGTATHWTSMSGGDQNHGGDKPEGKHTNYKRTHTQICYDNSKCTLVLFWKIVFLQKKPTNKRFPLMVLMKCISIYLQTLWDTLSSNQFFWLWFHLISIIYCVRIIKHWVLDYTA